MNVPAPGILANDTSNGGGPLSAQLVNTTTNGILTLAADGSFSYTPNPGFAGADSFRYRAVNNVGSGNEASVTITVVTGPQPPTELYAAKIKRNTVMLRFKPPTAGPAPTGYVLKGGVRPGEVLASPGMSGLELAHAVRKHYPSVRVILVSGYPSPASEAEHGSVHHFPFLRKPYRTEQVIRLLVKPD